MIKVIGFFLLLALTNSTLLLLVPFTLPRFLLCFAGYASGTIAMVALLFHPRSQWLVSNRSRVRCPDKPCVALTFDDGPSPDTTPHLLRSLREKQVKAVFFVVGEKAARHPDLLRQISAEGHGIGNHTYSHPALFCFLTPRRLGLEIRSTQETIQRICGVRPVYFRSPVGLRHPLLEVYLKRVGLEFISWRLRTYDTKPRSRDWLLDRVLRKVAPGDIILLHDNGSAEVVAMHALLPELIDRLKARGFDFVLP